MKLFIIISVFTVVVCLCTQTKGDCESYPVRGGPRARTGDTIVHQCAKYTCGEGGAWSSNGCGVSRCVDQIGETPYNYDAPYPECCPKPICKSDQA